jgi:hypothetical protein
MFELFKEAEQGWELLNTPNSVKTEVAYLARMQELSDASGIAHRVEKQIEGGSTIIGTSLLITTE